MGTVLLISLLSFKSVLLSMDVPRTPTWYRVFNYATSTYALALLAYTSIWLWRCVVQQKPERSFNADPLTGLLDWGGLMEVVQEERSDVSSGQPVRLLYVDMVGLKQVNALCGQHVGDSVLQATAEILKEETPPDTPIARLKGDEFIVLMRSQTPEEAERIRRRTVQRIERHNFGTGNAAVSCRATVIPRLSGDCRLVELLAGVRRGGTLKGGQGKRATDGEYCAIPQVTISACARYRFDNLKVPLRNALHEWRKSGDREFLGRMVREVHEVLNLSVNGRSFDFVTAPPGKETSEDNKPAHRLAERIAEELDAPYRKVLTNGPVSQAFAWMEPKVGAAIREGSFILLLSDCVDGGAHLRRCVEKLAGAGAFVQVVAWAAKV